MNKRDVKKLKILSTLIGTAIGFSVVRGGGVESKAEYPTMKETFYDTNDVGIDDAYEEAVEFSDADIEYLDRIERMVNLIRKIQAIDKDIEFDPNRVGEKYWLQLDYTDNETGFDRLENLENYVAKIEDSFDTMSPEEKEEAHHILTDAYHNIAQNFFKRVPLHLHDTTLKLVKVIGKDTLGTESVDDIKAYIDNSNNPKKGWYEFEKDGEKQTVRFHEDSSVMNKLLQSYLEYNSYGYMYPTKYASTEGVKELTDQYATDIENISKAVNSNYKVETGLFGFNPTVTAYNIVQSASKEENNQNQETSNNTK